MIDQSFALIPFPAPNPPAISLKGNLSLQKNVLGLHYSLVGEIEQVLLPPVSLSPSRKDELWKATCFEFFLAVQDQPGYWEFNMSPSGDWNVYRMDAYRRVGFREEEAISQLLFEFKKDLDKISLDVAVDLTPIIQAEAELQMGITAVIRKNDGNKTYWALTHPAHHADFHWRESFILLLAERTRPLEPSAPGD